MRESAKDAWVEWKRNALGAVLFLMLSVAWHGKAAWGGPAMVDSRTDSPIGSGGPAISCCGPATNEVVIGAGTTTTTTLPSQVLPVAGAADVNCPTTIPTSNSSQASWGGWAGQGQTCATGANAAGYNVNSISLFVATSPVSKHVRCSVYDGAAPKAKIAAGCDTAEATLVLNPNAYITVATTGTCHLAASTRYWIACAIDDNTAALGRNSTACTTCWVFTSMAYASAWPATLTSGGSYNFAPAYYMTVTPGP